MSHNKDAISLVTKVESDLFQKIVRQNDKFLVKDLSAINNELNIHLSGLISPTQLHVRYVFLNFSKSECILGLPFPKWSYSYASALD